MTAKPSRKDRDKERKVSPKAFAAGLRRLADAVEAGKPFVIRVAGERVTVPSSAELGIEHEREGTGEELEFQLKWQRPPRKPTR